MSAIYKLLSSIAFSKFPKASPPPPHHVEIVDSEPVQTVSYKPGDEPQPLRFKAVVETGLGAQGWLEVPVFINPVSGILMTWIGETECVGYSPEELGMSIAQKANVRFVESTVFDNCIVSL